MVSTWNTAQSGNWSVAANWAGGIPNATDATASFTTLGVTASSWSINLGGATYTLGTLNVAASVVEHYDFDNGTLAMKISSTARGASAFINVSSANNFSFSALDNTLTLSLLSRTTIDNLTAGKFDVAAKISGASALVATGSGTVLIDNASNNWTGGLVITGGTVQTQATNVLAGGALDVNTAGAILDLNGHSQTVADLTGAGIIETFAADATLTVNETMDTTFSGTLEDGSYASTSSAKLYLTKTGAATLTLASENFTQGATAVNQGTLKLGSDDALSIDSSVAIAGGATLDLGGFDTQIQIVSGAGSIVNSGSGAHYLQLTGASSFAGSISGAVNIQLDYPFTSLLLSGVNTYTGSTIIQGGSTLKAGANNAFSAASAYFIDIESAMDLNGYNETISSLSGPGTITNNGSSSSTSILTFTNNGVTIFTGMLADGAGKVGLDLTGSGTMVLAGANTNSATTTIEAGLTLAAGAENALSASSLIDIKANGELDLIGYDQVVGGLTDSGTVSSSVAGDVTLTVGPSPLGFSAFSGSITDGAGVVGLSVATGASFHLNGAASSYSGATNIGAGAKLAGDSYGALSADSIINISSTGLLGISADQTIAGLTGAGTVAFNEVQYTTLTVDDALSSTFSGQFGPGAPGIGSDLVKTGAGTLTLSGNNSKSGDMTVEGGTLAAGAANAFSTIGELAIVSSGTVDLAGYNETVGSLGSGFNSGGVLTNSGAIAATLTVSGGGVFLGKIKDGTSAIGLSLGATAGLSLGGANTYSGLTKIGAGAKLYATAANVFSAQSAVTIAISGALDIRGYNQTIGTISGTGSITNNGTAAATLTENNAAAASFTGTLADGSGHLALAKAGAGQLKLSGTNTYSGGTTIQGGALEFASAAAAGSGAIDFAGGATLQLDGAAPLTNTIEDFVGGDSIDFAGIAFAAGDHFILQTTAGGVQTWALETAANSVVTILKLAGHYGVGDFTIAAQGGGTAVGLSHNPQPLTDDFNSDLVSDILMTNPANGQLLIWKMDGTTRLASSGKTSSYPGTNYTIVGTGDFNGDGKADILMQDRSTGHTTIWFMDGTTKLAASGQAGSNQGVAYKALGAADFDGDGKSDILWQNTTTGQVSVWLMKGTTQLSGANVGAPLSSDWSFAGTGDFDGDGNADIMFQNLTTGAVNIWLMDGTTKAGGGTLAGTSGAGHEIVGIGDFNGDDKADLLWETTSTTALSIWFMNGMTRTSHDSIGDAGSGHVVVGTGDYNGDGKADILMQTTSSGHLTEWLMDGSTKLPSSGSVSSNPGTAWTVVSG